MSWRKLSRASDCSCGMDWAASSSTCLKLQGEGAISTVCDVGGTFNHKAETAFSRRNSTNIPDVSNLCV